MNYKLIDEAKIFLKSLEDHGTIKDLMTDRIDPKILDLITEYSNLIAINKKNIINIKDIITCSILIGYLLRGHLSRLELNDILQSGME
jgi:hypothetical protein